MKKCQVYISKRENLSLSDILPSIIQTEKRKLSNSKYCGDESKGEHSGPVGMRFTPELGDNLDLSH